MKVFCQYYDNPHDEAEIIDMGDVESHRLKKKLLLVLHFARELKVHSNELTSPPFNVIRRDEPLPHVKYWAKTKDGMLFRMACRDVQANFKDDSKLIVEATSRKVYFESGNTIEILTLSDMKVNEQFLEIRKKFSLLKEMSNHLN